MQAFHEENPWAPPSKKHVLGFAFPGVTPIMQELPASARKGPKAAASQKPSQAPSPANSIPFRGAVLLLKLLLTMCCSPELCMRLGLSLTSSIDILFLVIFLSFDRGFGLTRCCCLFGLATSTFFGCSKRALLQDFQVSH